jgi:lipoprotein-anchoring transpeptidase ErfK/SrfK
MHMILVRAGLVILALGAFAPTDAAAKPNKKAPPPLDMQSVNEAALPARKGRGLDPVALKTAILLDRARFSPGVVDGRPGENLTKAIKAFQIAQGQEGSGRLDEATWASLTALSAEPAMVEYVIKPEDVKGPFLDKLPPKMEEMQGLKALSFTSPREKLAETFHMSEALLTAMNPGKDFGVAGTPIVVANVAPARGSGVARDPSCANECGCANARACTDRRRSSIRLARTVSRVGASGAARSPERGAAGEARAARIEVNKSARSLTAFDADGKILAFYPASIGSRDKPAPSGTHEVRAVAENPTYTYNPDYAFKGVKSDRKFDIAGGPNNPVGAVWIDLSVESYGIHGTPQPEKVGKSYSHGCVRLTNWDALELAGMVRKGTTVEFKD